MDEKRKDKHLIPADEVLPGQISFEELLEELRI